jgi:hypothetical protein
MWLKCGGALLQNSVSAAVHRRSVFCFLIAYFQVRNVKEVDPTSSMLNQVF